MTRAEGRPDLHIALRAVGCDGERPSAKHDIFCIEKGDGRVASAHHQIGKLADVTLTPGMIEGERASIFVEMAHGARRCDGSFGGVGAIHGVGPLRKREHRLSAAAAYKKEGRDRCYRGLYTRFVRTKIQGPRSATLRGWRR